jgi:hypothetical protein
LIAHDLPGRHAPHCHLALARSKVLYRQAADVRRDAFDRFDTARAQHFLGRRRDRERHVEQRLLPLRRRYRDLLRQFRVEREVDDLRCAGSNLNGLADLAEAGGRDRNEVRARGERQRIAAVRAGRRRPRFVR